MAVGLPRHSQARRHEPPAQADRLRSRCICSDGTWHACRAACGVSEPLVCKQCSQLSNERRPQKRCNRRGVACISSSIRYESRAPSLPNSTDTGRGARRQVTRSSDSSVYQNHDRESSGLRWVVGVNRGEVIDGDATTMHRNCEISVPTRAPIGDVDGAP
jgi:hypothetical protein